MWISSQFENTRLSFSPPGRCLLKFSFSKWNWTNLVKNGRGPPPSWKNEEGKEAQRQWGVGRQWARSACLESTGPSLHPASLWGGCGGPIRKSRKEGRRWRLCAQHKHELKAAWEKRALRGPEAEFLNIQRTSVTSESERTQQWGARKIDYSIFVNGQSKSKISSPSYIKQHKQLILLREITHLLWV